MEPDETVIVYLEDGSLAACPPHHAEYRVASGVARYATQTEAASYWRLMEECDSAFREVEEL